MKLRLVQKLCFRAFNYSIYGKNPQLHPIKSRKNVWKKNTPAPTIAAFCVTLAHSFDSGVNDCIIFICLKLEIPTMKSTISIASIINGLRPSFTYNNVSGNQIIETTIISTWTIKRFEVKAVFLAEFVVLKTAKIITSKYANVTIIIDEVYAFLTEYAFPHKVFTLTPPYLI